MLRHSFILKDFLKSLDNDREYSSTWENDCTMKTVLITTSSFGHDDHSPLEMIKSAGLRCVLNPYGRKLIREELVTLLQEYQPNYIIAGIEEYDRRVLSEEAPFLKMISRCGTGVDNIDLVAARELGIEITNTPDAPTRSVAELTIAVILDLLRGVSYLDRNVRDGKFDKHMGNLLNKKTVGLVGCGRIGSSVAKLLVAFGCRVIGYDSFIDTHEDVDLVTFDELLKQADIISLHIPYTEKSKHVIDATAIEKMKDGVIVLNISRGGLVDESALYSALVSGKIKAAGVDCFEEEPYTGSLTELDNVVLTPHIGSYAIEARIEQEIASVKNILEYNKNG